MTARTMAEVIADSSRKADGLTGRDVFLGIGDVARITRALEAAGYGHLAAAWDEGYNAGDQPCETAVPCGDCDACRTPAPSNPYRL